MADVPNFEAQATPGELRAIIEAFQGAGLPVVSNVVEGSGWTVVGALHESLQSELGFRQRRQLVDAYRRNFLPGSRRWMVENLPDYQARFAVGAQEFACTQQDFVSRILNASRTDPQP